MPPVHAIADLFASSVFHRTSW